MSDGIKVDYAEIDRLTTGITALNTFAGPLVAKVGALSADGDLLASAILSPGTAVAAEGAVLKASAQLSVTIVSTEALVIITASFSKVYEAAELTLRAAALGLRVAWSVTGPFLAEVGTHVGESLLFAATANTTITATLVITIASAVRGAAQDLSLTAAFSLAEAFIQVDSPEDLLNGSFASDLAKAWERNFSWSNMWTDVTGSFESALGSVPGGYEALMFLVYHDGHAIGLFDDGHFERSHVDPDEARARAGKTLRDLQATVPEIADGVDIDPVTKSIIPHSLADVFAGAAQIDNVGKKDFADIRVIERYEDGKKYFTVQIPSTQRWFPMGNGNPWGQQAPNDFTSDVIALQQGDQTALAEAVKDAMRQANVGHNPVMLTGFSLGGITAGAIAAGNDGEFNIQQVATAGAPIGRMDIPSTVHVTALESPQDAVPKLDGASNPSNWDAGISNQETARLNGEDGSTTMSPKNVHDAARYAQMARNYSSDVDPELQEYLARPQGEHDYMKVTDYQAIRK
ncbi:hypothetical protein C1N91_05445 [Curtobacterium sp. SGAir0471]|uniref:hypothetical protein n=1 Tax=Curtobacterium sp. SGAir0471 TaxID=2070337 RepID=UPI0010CD6989|nr:hypothetical protein [Curtobacterium sp. SGAir0471]QCR43072.1 hypothetical protein C1N91_05445 [Curtobacterium sp. SGAir0471]